MEKAVDRRVRLLPVEYKKKGADVDREYYSTVAGQVGPQQARLEKLAWGGGSRRNFWPCVLVRLGTKAWI